SDAKRTRTKRGDQMRHATQSRREQRWRSDRRRRRHPWQCNASSLPEGSGRRRAHREPTGQVAERQQIRNGRQQVASLPHARAVHGANPLLLVQSPGASSSPITNSKAFQSPCASTCKGEASRVRAQPAGGGWGHQSSNTSVLSAASHVGGLVGHLETPGDIQDSDAHGPLTSGNDHVGGLAGSATGNLWNTAATCEVEGAEATGGLVGSANGSSIFHSHASGSVTGEARTGGLAGKLTASTVEQSYASGDVTKTSGLYVGGLVGALEAGSARVDAYAWGDVTGSGQDSGALIGYAVAGNTLTRVYATGAAERGGLVAVDDGNTSYASCYWHSDKHARAVGSLADDPAGTFGRSEAELLLE